MEAVVHADSSALSCLHFASVQAAHVGLQQQQFTEPKLNTAIKGTPTMHCCFQTLSPALPLGVWLELVPDFKAALKQRQHHICMELCVYLMPN